MEELDKREAYIKELIYENNKSKDELQEKEQVQRKLLSEKSEAELHHGQQVSEEKM